MSSTGLRVGALPSLTINGARFRCTTKGKEQAGAIPNHARKEIEKAGLSLRAPFEAKDERAIGDAFRYLTKKLHEAGKLEAAYSVHDLRHAFAVKLYIETKDIYQVSKALGHASVSVTERYLRSLSLEA